MIQREKKRERLIVKYLGKRESIKAELKTVNSFQEKLALYKLNDESSLTHQDISKCIPISNEAQIEEVLTVVLSGNHSKISQIVNRLRSQGVLPVTLVIAATRHFKILFAS